MKQSDIHGRSRIKKGKMFEDTNDVIISHNRIQLPSERGKKKDKQWSVKYYIEKIEQHELHKTPEGWLVSAPLVAIVKLLVHKIRGKLWMK